MPPAEIQGQPTGPIAIETRGLACGYDRRIILHDVNLALPRARVTCILGRSGCGKSTLLRTLLLLEPPLGGELLIDGERIGHEDHRRIESIRRRLGVLFQGAALFNSMTLLENAAFPIIEGSRVRVETARELALVKLDLVGLARFANYLPSAVSGGMRKRCGIARALAMDPEMLFLDEPSAGLDPVTAAGIDRLILDLRDRLGTTIVVVTHELASIEAIADHLVMIDEGRVVATGDAASVRRSGESAVRSFFERRLPGSEGPERAEGLAARLLPKEAPAG